MTLTPPLPVTLEIAPGADLSPNTLGFTKYVDISSYRRQSAPIEIEYGRDDEAAEVDAGTGAVTLDMRDGELCPYNPTGTYYEQLAQNVPYRAKLPNIWQDTFARAATSPGWGTATSGHVWTHYGNASLFAATGAAATATPPAGSSIHAGLLEAGSPDVEVRAGFSIDAIPQTSVCVIGIVLRRQDDDNYMSIYVQLTTTGAIKLQLNRRIGASGSNDIVVETTETFTAGDQIHLRVQAEGPMYRARVWVGDRYDDEVDFFWDIEQPSIETDGSGVGLFFWRLTGESAPGSRVFTTYYYEVDALLAAGNIPDLPPTWDKSGNDSVATVELAGALRLLGQMQENELIRSPVFRQLNGYLTDPDVGGNGLWSCEEPSGATTAYSALPGGPPAVVSGVTFGNSDAPPGIEATASLGTDTATFTARATNVSDQEFAALVFLKLPGAVTVDTIIAEWRCDFGRVKRWRLIYTPAGSFKVQGTNENGVQQFMSSAFNTAIEETNWFSTQLEVTENAGIVSYVWLWAEVGVDTFWYIDGSIAGQLGGVRELRLTSTSELNGMGFGMVWMGAETLPYVDTGFIKVANGYPDELAADRIARLSREEGYPCAVMPGVSTPLGPQPVGKFLDVLKDAADADQGTLYERGRGLGYRPYGARINRDVAFELSWSDDEEDGEGGDLAEAPQPSGDDQRYVSQWTVRRPNGGEATYRADEALVRRRGLKKAGDEFNLASDSLLPGQASWRTMMGTWPELRWPRIVIDLIAHPELIDKVLKIRVGTRIKITNPKAQVVGAEIDIIVEGVQISIGRHEWKVTLSCSPAKMWDVAVYGNVARRADARSSALAPTSTTYPPTETELVVWTTDFRDRWSTTATPYDWIISGERVTVTSITAAVDVGLGTWEQTATVERSVNGVSKTLFYAMPVHMHPEQQARYARR